MDEKPEVVQTYHDVSGYGHWSDRMRHGTSRLEPCVLRFVRRDDGPTGRVVDVHTKAFIRTRFALR